MGPIIYKTEGKLWNYYKDLSRQCWDEAHHSMLGEVGLYQAVVPFYKYPIEFMTTEALNKTATPLQAHVVLWHNEQGLMPMKHETFLEKLKLFEIPLELNQPICVMLLRYVGGSISNYTFPHTQS